LIIEKAAETCVTGGPWGGNYIVSLLASLARAAVAHHWQASQISPFFIASMLQAFFSASV
jgi:hypothetical protein